MVNKSQHTVTNLVVFLLLGGAVWITFGRAIAAPFFHDDRSSFVRNESIRRLWPVSVPLNPPRDTPFAGRPIVNLSAAVNYHFGELDPSGYRLLNMAVHALSAMLLYGVVRRTLVRLNPDDGNAIATSLATVVALLWAVHPLQTDAVGYVTQRTELIMGFCYLATLYCSIRYWQNGPGVGQATWIALAIAACLAGMASKEVMVSAPLAVLLYERTFVSGSFRRSLRASWPLYAGLASTWILLAYFVATGPRADSAGFQHDVAAVSWWLTQTKVLLLYLRLAFWPRPLSIHYELPYLTSFASAWPYVLTVGALIVFTGIGVWHRWGSGYLGAWLFMILSPTLVVPIVTEVAAERRMYLPLAAVVTMIVVGGYRLVNRAWARVASDNRSPAALPATTVAAAVVAIVVSVSLSAVSYARLGDYQDRISLWSSTVRYQPANATARYNLGIALKEVGRVDEAAEHFAQALKFRPRDTEFLNNYANALRILGQHVRAVEQLETALGIRPDMRQAQYNLGLTLLAMGRRRDAIEQFERLLEYHPHDVDGLMALGFEYSKAREFRKAVPYFERAAKLQPDRTDAHINLGVALIQSGRAEEAIAHLETAVRLAPDAAVGHFNLAYACVKLGRKETALRHARRALELARKQQNLETVQEIESWISAIQAVD